MPDIIVIGGGPAGVSAALTARNRSKDVTIVSGSVQDIPLSRAERVDNYPGLPAMTGTQLLETLRDHARSAGAALVTGRVLNVMPMGGRFGVSVGNDFFDCGAVILAAGITQKSAYPGERELLGAGVSYCATCDGMLYRGKRVAVLGLSAEAAEEAAFLRSIGCEVLYFDKKAKYEIRGSGRVEALVADGERYPVDGVFILRSTVAADNLIPGISQENGHIVVDGRMRTSIPGVFAAGDCTGKPYQVAKAVGEGCVAALSAAEFIDHTEKRSRELWQ
jgi:thioredoxin reductase (NADPH)